MNERSHIDWNFFLSNVCGLRVWETYNSKSNSGSIDLAKRALELAVLNLTQRQRQLIEMRYYRKMLMDDIAKELNISISTVSRTLKTARNKLYKYLLPILETRSLDYE